mmetsp:Transcript_23253/g.59181  ORF Transcript_23253/g.59181 Transcript_23253/m.59181 type:complete len:510 (+) Transcript_23253:106-1635(+)
MRLAVLARTVANDAATYKEMPGYRPVLALAALLWALQGVVACTTLSSIFVGHLSLPLLLDAFSALQWRPRTGAVLASGEEVVPLTDGRRLLERDSPAKQHWWWWLPMSWGTKAPNKIGGQPPPANKRRQPSREINRQRSSKNNMRQPLVFFTDRPVSSVRNIPMHGIEIIRVAQLCNDDVWLMTKNCSAAWDHPTLECYETESSAAHKRAELLLQLHPGPGLRHPNSKRFEMASIVRWLYLHQLMLDENVTHASFADLDVLVFSDLSAISKGHPRLARSDLVLTGRNGAISVWNRRALDSFVTFMMTIVTSCSAPVLSEQWSVDMGIIGRWMGVYTDAPMPPAMTQKSRETRFPGCSSTFPAPSLRIKVANFDLASTHPEPFRFFAGGIPDGPACSAAGCRPMAVPNCTAPPRERGYTRQHRVLRHPNPRFGWSRIAALWRVESRCTPYTRDTCDPTAMLPFHAVHFTGRFKEFLHRAAAGVRDDCQCLRGPIPVKRRAANEAAEWGHK